MLARVFHAWERALLAETTNRVVRPFDWGLDWIGADVAAAPEGPRAFAEWVESTMRDSDRFYDAGVTPSYEVDEDGWVRFPSALSTRCPENDTVHARYFPSARNPKKRAVVVLPQWNADIDGHVGLCRLLTRFGMSALRLSLPYHDRRMPPELQRADFIVSANVGRTLQANRQAVVDAKRAVSWLESRGYERIGILGTSLGSCLSLLTMAHDPRIRVGALNHVSPYFADVVWRGASTEHVREGLEGHIDLDQLRRLWWPISPWPYLDRLRERKSLLVYALYDLTFPLDLSLTLVDEFARRRIPHEVAVLRCGHYTTGKTPFKWIDGYHLTKFLATNL
ncbi:MAG: hypothetical protein U0Q12_19015 [Vicinamibacterales bacterium]